MKRFYIPLALVLLVLTPLTLRAQPANPNQDQLHKALELIRARETDKALELLQPLTEVTDPHTNIKAFRLIGSAHLTDRNTDRGVEALNKALELSRTVFDRHEEAYALYLLARAGTQKRNFEEAKTNVQKAALIARTLNDKELEYRIQNIMTWTYYATGESFYKILDQEAEVYKLVTAVGNDIQKANAYNNLGYDLTVAGTVPVDSAISLMKFANNTYAEAEGHQGRWYTLMNLTWQHRLKLNLEKSKEYGQKSLSQALSEEDRHAIVEAAFQLGETLIVMDQVEEARPHYETGLKWRGNEEDRDRYVFDVYYARFLWESGEQDRAISMLESATDWLTQSEVFYEMHGRALLASYYWQKGQTDLAAEQLDILENPRGDYISLESRFIGATVRAKWFAQNGQSHMGKALMESWLAHTKDIGVEQLSRMAEHTLKTL